MFQQAFQLAATRTRKESAQFYFAHWLLVMAACVVLSAPTVLFWGNNWHSNPEEALKLAVAGTHAVCAAYALFLSIAVVRAKGLTLGWLDYTLIVLGTVLSGMFGGLPAPLAAAWLSTQSPRNRVVKAA